MPLHLRFLASVVEGAPDVEESDYLMVPKLSVGEVGAEAWDAAEPEDRPVEETDLLGTTAADILLGIAKDVVLSEEFTGVMDLIHAQEPVRMIQLTDSPPPSPSKARRVEAAPLGPTDEVHEQVKATQERKSRGMNSAFGNIRDDNCKSFVLRDFGCTMYGESPVGITDRPGTGDDSSEAEELERPRTMTMVEKLGDLPASNLD